MQSYSRQRDCGVTCEEGVSDSNFERCMKATKAILLALIVFLAATMLGVALAEVSI